MLLLPHLAVHFSEDASARRALWLGEVPGVNVRLEAAFSRLAALGAVR